MGIHEDEVPGVTFNFLSASLRAAHRPGERHLLVTLDAVVTDEEVWTDVENKLKEGIRIYKGEDFHTAVLDAVKADLSDLRKENDALTRELRKEKDARQLAEQDLERYKAPFAKLGSALRGG
jgi:hypothetical protein